MRWASAASDDADLATAIRAAARQVREQLGAPPELIVAFVSAHHAEGFDRTPRLIAEACGSGLLLGCSAGGVIGGGREIEQRPGVALSAAILPDVTLRPFHLESATLPSAGDIGAWRAIVGDEAMPHFLLLPEPFSFDAEALIHALDRAYPQSSKIGGIASGGRAAGEAALFLGGQVFRTGAVGLALAGDLTVDTIVAQGCRPIGDPMFVTSCDRNVVRALDGRPPLDVLRELHERLDEHDRQLARQSLFLGIVMADNRQEYRHGDFLIRNLLGIDPNSGALAVGALLDENRVVQFHLRDGRTSAQDLDAMLRGYRSIQSGGPIAAGSLLFSCLGRGQSLYGEPDHDSAAFRQHLGEIPLGGFFCNGEIGPVRGTTFLHGYTSSFGLFRRLD